MMFRTMGTTLMLILLLSAMAEHGSARSSEDKSEVQVTIFSYYSDVDDDGKLDIYCDGNNAMKFYIFQNDINVTRIPIHKAKLFVNITFGAYTNTSILRSDEQGMALRGYSGRFQDSNTGFDFQIPARLNQYNMTITIKAYKDDILIYDGSIYCTYHMSGDPYQSYSRQTDPLIVFHFCEVFGIICYILFFEIYFMMFIIIRINNDGMNKLLIKNSK
jgi:hypothetical protein